MIFYMTLTLRWKFRKNYRKADRAEKQYSAVVVVNQTVGLLYWDVLLMAFPVAGERPITNRPAGCNPAPLCLCEFDGARQFDGGILAEFGQHILRHRAIG